MWLPDARFQLPELFDPRRKPTGKVRIDHSHPLADKISFCLLFQDNSLVDLVSGKGLEVNGDPQMGSRGLIFDEVGDYLVFPDFTMNSKYSIMYRGFWDEADGDSRQCVFAFDTSGAPYIYLEQSEEFEQDSASYLTASTFGGGTPGIETNRLLIPENYDSEAHDPPFENDPVFVSINEEVCLLTVNAFSAKIYFNGVLDVTEAVFGSSPILDGTVDDIYIGREPDGTNPLGAEMYFIYVFDKELSAIEAKELSDNPYAFLI